MGNIPLPALGIQPPQYQDPLKQYAEAVSLRNLQQQMQQRQALAPIQQQQAQEQLRATQLENQRSQQQFQDAQIFADSLRKHNGDYDAALDEAQQNGMSGIGYMQHVQQITALKSAQAKLTGDQLDNQGKLYDKLDGQLQSYKALSTDEQAKQWPTYRTNLLKQAPQLANVIPAQAPSPDQINGFEAMLLGGKQATANELKRREVTAQEQTAGARATAAQTGSEALKARMPGGALYAPTLAGQEAQARLGVETSPQAIAGAAAKSGAEAQARIAAEVSGEVQKAQALAPTLDQVTKTTAAGRPYVDLTNLSGPQASIIKQQALAKGIPLADKDTANTLVDIDTANKNMQFMLDTVGKKLASGAPERLWYGPKNTIERLAQTDPELAAMGTYRNAAIQTMRAVAGSKGLRINNAEIQMAIDNDIPKPSDTLPVAQAKLNNLKAFLDNHEEMLLNQNRQNPGATPNVLRGTSFPAKGTTKTNSHGDKLVSDGTKWVIAQ